MKTKYRVPIVLAACLSAAAAVAAPPQSWYVGGSFGGVNTNVSGNDLRQALVNQGFNITSVNFDDATTGWKLFGGYQFMSNLAVEASYVNLGKIDTTVKATGVTDVNALVQTAANAHGYSIEGGSIDLVGLLPLGPAVLFGKLGATYWHANIDVDAVNTGVSISRSKNGTGANWGAGVKFPVFHNQIQIRAEWESIRVSSRWIDFYSAGVEFHF